MRFPAHRHRTRLAQSATNILVVNGSVDQGDHSSEARSESARP
jgi:hypothetical protein